MSRLLELIPVNRIIVFCTHIAHSSASALKYVKASSDVYKRSTLT